MYLVFINVSLLNSFLEPLNGSIHGHFDLFLSISVLTKYVVLWYVTFMLGKHTVVCAYRSHVHTVLCMSRF